MPAEAIRRLAERIPGAELPRLPATGHGTTGALRPEVYGWLLERAR